MRFDDESAVYEVLLTEPAEIEIETAYLYHLQFGLPSAERWYSGLVRSLERLTVFPYGFSIMPEQNASPHPMRQMIYGRGKNALRILYRVNEPEENEIGIVYILHVRPSLQRPSDKDSDREEDE